MSYTNLEAGGDVDAIGAHCQLPECHRLDFLPFRCESCHGFVSPVSFLLGFVCLICPARQGIRNRTILLSFGPDE